MLKIHKPITVQTILIAIALVAGICIRLIQLNQIPLDDHEAMLALQAYRFSAGLPTTLDGEPFYLLLTIALFSIFGSSVYLARLVPALMGILLLASPLLIRKYLKPLELILVVWLLALEPSLVVASRSINSAIIALSLSVMLFAAYMHHKKKTSGALLALLILSGTSFWCMAVMIVISLLLWILARRRSMDWQRVSGFLKEKEVWLTGLLTLAVGGSFFFLIPSGLNTVANAIPAFVQEILTISGMMWWLPPLALLIYSSLVVVFGIWGSIRSCLELNPRRFLVLLALVGLGMLLLFPGRNLIHLVWITTPLIFLAAYILSDQFSVQPSEIVPSLGITLLVVIIVLFLWQIFGRLNAGYLEMQLFWFALGGGIAILLLSALLAIFGWSHRIALFGYTWGFLTIFLLSMIMSTFHSIKPADPIRVEMWNNGISHPDQALLIQTIEDTSGWTRGNPIGLDIQVVGPFPPSLEWVLRNHDRVQQVNAVSPGDQPDIVITSVDDQPDLAQQYRGQDFFLKSRVMFEAFQSEDWFRWIMLRKTTVVEQQPVILWIRSDLFPGGIVDPNSIQ